MPAFVIKAAVAAQAQRQRCWCRLRLTSCANGATGAQAILAKPRREEAIKTKPFSTDKQSPRVFASLSNVCQLQGGQLASRLDHSLLLNGLGTFSPVYILSSFENLIVFFPHPAFLPEKRLPVFCNCAPASFQVGNPTYSWFIGFGWG